MSAQREPDPRLDPMSPDAAQRLGREIAKNGDVVFSAHAQEEMKKDDLHTTDCLNLIRAGVYGAPELNKGELRYRIETPRMCVVVVFRSKNEIRVVTAWRKR